MTKIYQQIKTSEDNCLYIIGWNEEKQEIKFRVSRQINQLQTETVFINGSLVYTNLYKFHVNYLLKFIEENKK